MEGSGGTRSAREMTREEIGDFLRAGFWGVIATSVADQPYGVPIIYGYDDDGSIYVANGPGRKIEMMEQNPNVTLTVVEVVDLGKRWRSVIVHGRVEMVEGLSEKLHAFNTLRRQIPSANPRLRDAAKLAAAKVIRIVPVEVTGKAIW